MGYNTKGRVELTSNKEIDDLVVTKYPEFLEKNNFTTKDIEQESHMGSDFGNPGNALKRLVAFAGFNTHDSSFGYVLDVNQTPETIIHTIRMDGNYDAQRVEAVLNYFADLGMGVYGEFEGEDGIEWELVADFGDKLLVENFLQKVSTREITSLNKSTETLNKIASIVGVTTEELVGMVDSGEFAHRTIFSKP